MAAHPISITRGSEDGMDKLERLGMSEMSDEAMAGVSGGWHVVDTGGADEVVQWFVQKMLSPDYQQPADSPTSDPNQPAY
jgi:hypothetical protein